MQKPLDYLCSWDSTIIEIYIIYILYYNIKEIKINKRDSPTIFSIHAVFDHMMLQLKSRKTTEGLAAIWGLAFNIGVSHLLFYLSFSSFPSLHPILFFNWLPVKVLLSGSTCPCHHKQRWVGDTVLSHICSPFIFVIFYNFLLSYFFLSSLDIFLIAF